jgi:outer membrane autotransporter protein
VTNAATVSPGDSAAQFGTLTIQGDYTQTATGLLLIQIGSASQYGRLAVSGTAALDGTLQVSLLNNYVPDVGTSFQILTFAQSTGDFDTELGLRLRHHRHLTSDLDSTDLTLTADD